MPKFESRFLKGFKPESSVLLEEVEIQSQKGT